MIIFLAKNRRTHFPKIIIVDKNDKYMHVELKDNFIGKIDSSNLFIYYVSKDSRYESRVEINKETVKL